VLSLTAAGLAAALLALAAPEQGGRHAQPIQTGERVDRIRIYKARHRLEAWSGKRLFRVYRVAIGRGGRGHKQTEGDGRTPEGSYTIDAKHASARFHRFLHVSYPSAADREAFARARKAGRLPQSARLGGAIGIHGQKKGWLSWLPHKWIDWTQGCVAVDNPEIDELYRVVRIGARVEILP